MTPSPDPEESLDFYFPLGHKREFSLVHVCKHLLSPNHGPGSALGARDAATVGPSVGAERALRVGEGSSGETCRLGGAAGTKLE